MPQPDLADSVYRGGRLGLGVAAAAAAAAAAAVAAGVYVAGGSSHEGVSAMTSEKGGLMSFPSPHLAKDMSAWSREEVKSFVNALERVVGEDNVATDEST